MQRFSWLHNRMTGGPPTRRLPSRKRTPRLRPRLELLDRRVLLSFAAPVTYASDAYASRAVVAADMNGDGKPDLINLYDGGISSAVRLNNGNGTFGDPYTYAAVNDGIGITLAVSVKPGALPEIVVTTNPRASAHK